MKWLERISGAGAQPPADNRFVAKPPSTAPPAHAARPSGRGDGLTVQLDPRLTDAAQRMPQEQLSCLLVTEDPWMVEQVAGIALAAAVRVQQCSPAESATIAQFAGPVLWAIDTFGQLHPQEHLRCDVLLSAGSDSAQLWLAASCRPQSRVAILPEAAGWLGEYLGQWSLRSGQGYTLSFAGLAGGIGTSALASLLAHAGTLSALHTVLIDLDPFSSSLWPLLDWQPAKGIGWEELQSSGGTLAAHQFAEALARTQQTAVLTWHREPGRFTIDESLAVRVLAAARQAFDLVVIDTGRYIHPLAPALTQFTDQHVLTGHLEQRKRLSEIGHPYICATPSGRPVKTTTDTEGMLGVFPFTEKIAHRIERAELWDCLRSHRLRQRIADYDLLPTKQVNSK